MDREAILTQGKIDWSNFLTLVWANAKSSRVTEPWTLWRSRFPPERHRRPKAMTPWNRTRSCLTGIHCAILSFLGPHPICFVQSRAKPTAAPVMLSQVPSTIFLGATPAPSRESDPRRPKTLHYLDNRAPQPWCLEGVVTAIQRSPRRPSKMANHCLGPLHITPRFPELQRHWTDRGHARQLGGMGAEAERLCTADCAMVSSLFHLCTVAMPVGRSAPLPGRNDSVPGTRTTKTGSPSARAICRS